MTEKEEGKEDRERERKSEREKEIGWVHEGQKPTEGIGGGYQPPIGTKRRHNTWGRAYCTGVRPPGPMKEERKG